MVKLEEIKNKKLLHEFILQSTIEFIDDAYVEWLNQTDGGKETANPYLFYEYLKKQLRKEVNKVRR